MTKKERKQCISDIVEVMRMVYDAIDGIQVSIANLERTGISSVMGVAEALDASFVVLTSATSVLRSLARVLEPKKRPYVISDVERKRRVEQGKKLSSDRIAAIKRSKEVHQEKKVNG